MILETKRLLLRPWEDGDAAQLYRHACDPEVGPRAGWPVHKDEADSLQVIRGVLSAPETYAVVLKETGLPVGSIGLKEPEVCDEDLPDGAAQKEIGYWVGRAFWGRGIIPEAVRAVLRRGFEDLNCDVIWCGHYDFNDQSRRVIEKCGFHRRVIRETTNLLGDTHETVFYALTREEWQER